MNNDQLFLVLQRLKVESVHWPTPVAVEIACQGKPFLVLASCILSLRTRDETMGPAAKRLFQLADTPQKLLRVSLEDIEKAIYPVAFYRNKAKTLLLICEAIVDRFAGVVPSTLDELMQLQGVGRKTANLTMVLGFDKMGICVDVHVHRICNRWGYLETKEADETEKVLREILPQQFWKEINALLVAFGKTVCKPVSPVCSKCPVENFCNKVNLIKTR